MRSHITLALAVASALTFSMAGTAAAAPYTATYTGTVQGTDVDGLFGPVGADLGGASFTAIFTYDPTLGTRSTYAGTDFTLGGSQVAGSHLTSPILSDSLTINGVSYSLDPSQYGLAEVEGPPSGSTLLEYVAVLNSSPPEVLAAGLADQALSVTADLTQAQSYSSTNSSPVGGFIYGNDSLTLIAKTADISTSVPEPGSLALMAGAVGLLAFARRRRSI